MFEITGQVPFLWRLSAVSGDGYCSISMVVPCPPEARIEDFTIETNVVSLSCDGEHPRKEETVEWNKEDIDLFLRLINQRRLEVNQPLEETVRVDLSDPEIIDIIDVVAAAGFGMTFPSSGLLKQPDDSYPVHDFDVGSAAALNTVNGFKSCIVVDIQKDDVVCVLLEELNFISSLNEPEQLARHDLLLVRPRDILHPDFAEPKTRPETSVLH